MPPRGSRPKSTAVVNPNYGIYYDRAPIALDPRMLQDGYNFRIREGRLSNLNLGWVPYVGFEPTGNNTILKCLTIASPTVQLAQPVLLINAFTTRGLGEFLIFGTPFDLYAYSASGGGTVKYITPTYTTGTASASGTAVTGTSTLWSGIVKAGDEISFGSATQNLQTATWFVVSTVNSNTSITLASSAGTVTNGVYTIRRKFTGGVTNIWNTEQFLNAAGIEDRWYATNGIDSIVRWNGTDTFATLLETGSFLGLTCKTLRQYANQMIYANLVQSGVAKPTDIINSDTGNPEALTGGVANQFKVHSRADGIAHMQKLGDYLAIYSGKGVTMALFVGVPTFYTFREAVTGKGPLGSKAVARFPNYHEFIAADSLYAFDGATIKEVNKHIWRTTLRQQDPVRTAMTYAHFDEQNGDLLWVVPSTTDPGSGTNTSVPQTAVVEHYLEDTGAIVPSSSVTLARPNSRRAHTFYTTGYTTRNQAITWDQLTNQWSQYNFRWNDQFFFAAFPLNLGGGADGKVYNFAAAQDAAGAALPSFVRFGRRPTIDGFLRGLVRRIIPFVTTFGNPLNVTARMADFAMGPTTVIQTNSFDQNMPEGKFFTNPFRRGRYIEVEFGTNGPSQPWELSGYDTQIVPGGAR